MLKVNFLLCVFCFVMLPAHAENWRYCAANAPMSAPCKAWVSAYLAGHAPETDPQEVPRYLADNTLSLSLNPVSRGDLPSFGEPSYRAVQPFLKVSSTVLVR
ncbi:MAG: hypothetical protein EXR37_07110 [Limnohabitans sp.]|nr:hypothetical protein [Limnohabitans sp.]